MSQRKHPVVLRKGPVSDAVYVLTNYRPMNDGKVLKVIGDGKHDVSADYDSMVLEEFIDYGADNIVGILDGVYQGETLSPDDLEEVRILHDRLVNLIERHNERHGHTTS